MIFKEFHGYNVWENGNIELKNKLKFISPHKNKNGYWIVKLHYDNKTHTHYVHRLVAELFLDRPDGCDIVDHLDRDTSNNCVSNLEWVTRAENAKRATYAIRREDNRIGKNTYSARDISHTRNRPSYSTQVFA